MSADRYNHVNGPYRGDDHPRQNFRAPGCVIGYVVIAAALVALLIRS